MQAPTSPSGDRLAWESRSWRSIELVVRQAIHDLRPKELQGNKAYDTLVEHYIEAPGPRRFLQWDRVAAGKAIGIVRYYGDGDRCADVFFQGADPTIQTHVLFKHSFFLEGRSERTDRPIPLRFFQVGRVPLHEAIAAGEAIGEDRVLGRPCDAYLFKGVKWAVVQDQVFSLDRETAVPLKVAAFKDEEARRADQPLWVWAADSFDEIQGRHIPLKSSSASYHDGRRDFERTFTVESLEFDKDYPASTFRPEIGPGVRVFDTTKNRDYVTPGTSRIAPPKADAAREAAPEVVQPIRAAPPLTWASFAAPTGLAVGLALLAVSLFLWWRRR